MNNLSSKVLEVIQEKKIKPKAKWKFTVRNVLIWVASILSLIISGLGLSIIIYYFKDNDWDLHRRLAGSLFNLIVQSAPYFWLVFLAVFILLIYRIFKQTKKGYKYTLILIVGISLVASILLGVLFNSVGFAQAIEDKVLEKVPMYRRFLDPRARFWDKAQQGFLGGMIKSVNDQNIMRIWDLNKQEWEVFDGQLIKDQREMLVPGKYIKIIGQPLEGHRFKAREIYPWGKPQMKRIFMK